MSGRANVAKATYASVGLIIMYFSLKPKSKNKDELAQLSQLSRRFSLSVVLICSSNVDVLSANMQLFSTVLSIILVCCVTCDGARILSIFPVPSPSHNILATRLTKELVNRGHEVTLVSPFPQKESKNFKSVQLTGFLEKQKEMMKDLLDINKQSFFQKTLQITNICTLYSETTLNHTNFRKLLNSDATFDLIIIEAMFNEAHVGIGYHYNAPVIMLSTVGSSSIVNKFVANPAPSSMVPDTFLGLPSRMNFVQRMVNTLATGLMDLFHQFYHLRVQNNLLQEYFPDAPHLQDVIREHVSLLLLNGDPSFDGAKPLMPNMVHIGGYHVEEPKALPQVNKQLTSHPRLRVFITHGGLLSTTEAIYHGAPIVGIPIFGDQKANMVRAVELGIGTSVAFDNITVETLTDAIREVVNNKIYKVRATQRSRLLKDQPQRPLDTAMFWIEYVLRNKDTSHLKNPAIYLEWYQINMLDVHATLAGVVILVSALFYLLMKKLCCSKKAEKKRQQELNKKKKN
ncbi:UDP-glycosyltransferase family 35 member B1 [Carabus blaptoides fortunei]